MRNKNTKILAYSTILLSVSLILGYVESIFPISIGDIGIKIGLSNVVSIIGLKTIGFKKTFLLNVLRLIILGMLFGNLIRFIISVSGFLLSYIIMSYALLKVKFSIYASSILGGVSHNLGQFLAIIVIMNNLKILYIFPIYVIIGILTGLLVGIIAKMSLKIIKI